MVRRSSFLSIVFLLLFVFDGTEQSEPQENGDLTGDAQQVQFPEIIVANNDQGQVDGHDEAPDDGGDVELVPAEIMPGRPQAQQYDGIGGNGIQENQPAVRIQKIKGTGAERRVYAQWAERYRKQLKYTLIPPGFAKWRGTAGRFLKSFGIIVLLAIAVPAGVRSEDYIAFQE